MLEVIAQYQKFYGFKPMGAHRDFLYSTMKQHCARCAQCAGDGIEKYDGPQRWRYCTASDGLGMVWTSTPAEVEAARAVVAARFPEAIASRTLPHLTSPFNVFDIATSTMIDIREPRKNTAASGEESSDAVAAGANDALADGVLGQGEVDEDIKEDV